MNKGILLLLSAATVLFAEDCVPFKKAAELADKDGCVVGQVLHVSESRGGNLFVNFCSDYRNCPFSAVVLKRSHAQLGDLLELEGRTVEFRGHIKVYRGQPEMELISREQLRIPDDKAVEAGNPTTPSRFSDDRQVEHRPAGRSSFGQWRTNSH